MKKNVKLNGQLRLYVRWPLYLTLLLIGMNLWIYVLSLSIIIGASKQ